ncbi:MAG: cytochrome b N-terminal domain-containing protein [Pseudomonadota bacterium]
MHPPRVCARSLGATATLGLGIITATLFAILTVTGILLMVYYLPSVDGAYESVQDIELAVAHGSFLRALHRWAAHAMVVSVVLHVARIVATAAYRKRELNWLIGIGLLLLTIGFAFTGYLLPWDQLSYWAVRVGTAMLDQVPGIGGAARRLFVGGDEIGQAGLLRFYVLHVAVLPALATLLVALHLWRIRKDGGLARPVAGAGAGAGAGAECGQPQVNAWPHLMLREAAVSLGVLLLTMVAALVFRAPLGAPPDFYNPTDPEKAPWYFLWAQEAISYSAIIGAVVLPGFLFAVLLVLPAVERETEGTGQWLGTRSSRRAAVVGLVVGSIGLVACEALYLSAYGSAADATPAGSWWWELVNPGTAMMVIAIAASFATRLASGSTRAATVAGLVVLTVALLGFTVLGLCRGPGWQLYWPWEDWPVVG